MGNTETNESNTAGSSEEDLARRRRENMATAVEAATTVAAVVAAGWAVTKLLSYSASEEDEKTNDKGKSMVAVGTSSGYRIPRKRFEDSHSDSEDEETDEELQYLSSETDEELQRPIGWLPINGVAQACRGDYQISGEKICWRFPGYGKLKMNTDGSVKWRSRKKDGRIRYINPPQAGFGGVIRNESGSLIMGFYGRLKDGCGVLEAELWGIYKGLEIIRGRNLREVEIESDSTSAVYLIMDETAYKKSPFKELVERCKATKQETGCTLERALCEGNGVADELARRGRRDRYNNFISFTAPPDKIIKRLLAVDVAAASS